MKNDVSNGTARQRYLSERTAAWLLEYYLASTTSENGGVDIPSLIAATEITGVNAPLRENLSAVSRAWRFDTYERTKSGEPGEISSLPYIRNGRPTG